MGRVSAGLPFRDLNLFVPDDRASRYPAFHPGLLSRITALFGLQLAWDITEILPSFANMPKPASNSAARSFVRLRSLLHSVFPSREANAHRILSHGDCLDRVMEGEMRDEFCKNKDLCQTG
jgi:hypothetical protein